MKQYTTILTTRFSLPLILIFFLAVSCSEDVDDTGSGKAPEEEEPIVYFDEVRGGARSADFLTDGSFFYQGNYEHSTGQLPERGVYKMDKTGKLITNFDWTKDKSWWPVKPQSGFERWGDVFVHGDGVLLTGEYIVDGATYHLIRLKSDGSLDRDFLSKGRASATVRNISVTRENSIFVTFDNAVLKLDADGTLDNSFTFNQGGTFHYGNLRNTIPLPNGQVFVTGGFGLVYNGYLWRSIVKLGADGTVDTSFSLFEKLEASYVPGVVSEGSVRDAIVQTDGKVLICGIFFRITDETQRDTHYNYPNIARLLPNGSVDTSFKAQEEGGELGLYPGMNGSFYYHQREVRLDHSRKLYHSDKDGNLLAEFSPDGEFRDIFPISDNEALVVGDFSLGHDGVRLNRSPLVRIKRQ